MKLTTAEALEYAKSLLGCWRTGEPGDPVIFGAAIAAVLQMYSHEVVQYVCDPRCGMPFTNKWPPTSPHEVKEACDLRADIIFGHEEMARRDERRRDQGVAVAPPEPVKPTHEEMEAKHGKGWGIISGPVPNDYQMREFAKTLPIGSKWTAKQLIDKWRAEGFASAESEAPDAVKTMTSTELAEHYSSHGLSFGPTVQRLTREPAVPVPDVSGNAVDEGADF
jgi:hypothetical protein